MLNTVEQKQNFVTFTKLEGLKYLENWINFRHTL